jgi:60 kDa SS-A/Ro ribonucleoprotein
MPKNDPLGLITTRRTPQLERATPAQVRNDAGGYVFDVGDDAAIHRFLTLGTTGGTYYTGQAELTKAAAGPVLGAAQTRGRWLVDQLTAVSIAGRAPSNSPALFALAAVAGLGDQDARSYALATLPGIARTGSHLFTFAGYLEQFRGWGRGARKALGAWYLEKTPDALSYQLAKYRQRDGWTHRDLLRLAHPQPPADNPAMAATLQWAAGKAPVDLGNGLTAQPYDLPGPLQSFEQAQRITSAPEWVELIESGAGLSWEMFPDAALTEPSVWRALIERGRVPAGAMLRQLPRLTRLGVLDGTTREIVTATLTNPEVLRRARLHPVNVLVAARTYASGQGKGSAWTPVRQITDALDQAFYAAYGSVEPAGKRTLVALDVSGSMGIEIGGKPLTSREFAAAMALVLVSTEPSCDVVGFTSGARSAGWGSLRRNQPISPLDISPRRRLDDVLAYTAGLDFGGTDCALPVTDALKRRADYDTFVVITDSETWAGPVHVHQALAQYRAERVPDARFITVATTATRWTINDPADPLGLDVAGFDAAIPTLITDFSAGRL